MASVQNPQDVSITSTSIAERQRVLDSIDSNNVDVDWLYRNKKKVKKSNSNETTTKDEKSKKEPSLPSNVQISKSSIPSTGISGSLSSNNVPTKNITPKQPSEPAIPQVSLTSTLDSKKEQEILAQHSTNTSTSTSTLTSSSSGKSLLSKALRPRATSDPRRDIQIPTTTSQSTNQPTTGSSLTRSNSLNGPKPIKSLFSAFSKIKGGKSAPSSPVSQPLSIPKPHNATASHSAHIENHRLSSSLESISPTFGPAYLPSPSHKLETLSESSISNNPPSRVVLNKNPNRSELPIRELSELKLRRVTFALDKLPDDPPQQIPSRRPKKGNVIVVEDLFQTEPLRLSLGITNELKPEASKYDDKELSIIKATQKKALEESEKHAQEAHKAAQRIAFEVTTFRNKSNNNSKKLGLSTSHSPDDSEFENEIMKGVSKLEIDSPIHLHEHHFGDEIIHNDDLQKISLENIYTRCCHLREILPIPATLKQLKNKSSPLHVLKLLNPKPTLIDVYSYCDFIAIVPIKTLVFDNVTITTEMFKIILSSLINSTTIEKLSLRNVPIDNQGWKFLCKFLSRNKSITKLDISQQKIKSDLSKDQIRSQMDWNLFTNTLSLRGGIEELIINGCKLPVKTFNELMERGIVLKTKRLGIAQIDISLDHLKIISNWVTSDETSQLEGLDLGFNNLNDKLNPLIKKIPFAKHLQSISINSTGLQNVEDAALLIRSLSKLPDLRFLDLSNLKQLFPSILPYLNKYLPRFPNLRRIHLDFNELSSKSISIISEIIPQCHHLVHVSMIGLTTISYAAGASIYSAVKSSKTLLNMDLDYDLIDEKINSRIAVCLMRNMERSLNNDKYLHLDDHEHNADDTHDDILFDGSLIAETAGTLIDKFSKKETDNDEFTEKFLQEHLVNKIKNTRAKVNHTIDILLQKRDDQHVQLTLEEKETLLRFYFLENSLAKISEVFTLEKDEFQETIQQHQKQQQELQQSSTQNTQQPAAAAAPHEMVLEMSGGKETPIDGATGRPILLRSVSQTSVHAKKLEEEEGEFHRWGFFVQQQRQILPDQPISADSNSTKVVEVKKTTNNLLVPKLPSGEEIREAVIKAKGIDSINSLIESVNNDTFNLNMIYPNLKDNHKKPEVGSSPEDVIPSAGHESIDIDSVIDDDDHDDSDSVDSDHNVFEVDEAYDKILNDLSRVRSNK